MAVASGAMSTVEADVEISANGTSWTSLSDYVTMVEVPEQTRMTGVGYTFGADVGVVTAGKREPMEVTIRGLYSEGASDAYRTVRSYFSASGGTVIYFRYSPKGIGASGRSVFTASNDAATAGGCVVSKWKFPDVDAGAADPVPFFFAIMVPSFVETTTSGSTGLGS